MIKRGMSRSPQDPTASNSEWEELWRIDTSKNPEDIPLEQLDPSHPMLFEADKQWDYFRRLRREAPVHYCPESQFGPYWSVTDFNGCMYVDTHHKIFSSDFRHGDVQLGGYLHPEPEYQLLMFLMEDPPRHGQQRGAVAPTFTMRNLTSLEPLIRSRVCEILDELPINEEFNWVEKVSIELTGRMLTTLLGVPQEDQERLVYWSDVTQNLRNPDFFASIEEAVDELRRCGEYFFSILRSRRRDRVPGNDLISMLVHNKSTRRMSPREFLGNALLLIVGGNDTTRNAISGSILALNQNPGEYDKLTEKPNLIPSMVPETIRWYSPVSHMARTTLVDTEINGKKIRAGDRVAMWYISGNRDETVVPNADQLIIDRKNPRHHLSFGYGIHRCLGSRLGEMQLRVMWEEILSRFSRVEMTGDPVYSRSNFVHGIRELPVRLHSRR